MMQATEGAEFEDIIDDQDFNIEGMEGEDEFEISNADCTEEDNQFDMVVGLL